MPAGGGQGVQKTGVLRGDRAQGVREQCQGRRPLVLVAAHREQGQASGQRSLDAGDGVPEARFLDPQPDHGLVVFVAQIQGIDLGLHAHDRE